MSSIDIEEGDLRFTFAAYHEHEKSDKAFHPTPPF